MRTKKGTIHVRDRMKTEIVTVEIDQTIGEAVDLMRTNRLSSLPVVESGDRCVGILSAADVLALVEDWGAEIDTLNRTDTTNRFWLVEKLSQQGLSEQPVRERMTPNPLTIKPTATLIEAARKMITHNVHHLVVLNEKKHPVGILSTMDLIHVIAEGAVDDE